MNEIGPEAKSLFAAARSSDPLPGPQRARIKKAVLVQAATLGAASGVAGGALAMSMAAKVTLVTVTAVAVGGGSASLWAWKKHKQSPQGKPAAALRAKVGQPAIAHQRPLVAPIEAPLVVPEASPAVPAPAQAQAFTADRGIAGVASSVQTSPSSAGSARAEAKQGTSLGTASRRLALAHRASSGSKLDEARPPTAIPAPRVEPDSVVAPSVPTRSTVVDERPAVAPAPVPGAPQERVAALPEARRVPAGPWPLSGPTSAVKAPAFESLEAELNLLAQAQEDLRLGSPARALRRLASFDSQFPSAKMGEEREAIEAIATCQLQPGPAAWTRAQGFLYKAPLSPLAPRVRSACQPRGEGKSLNESTPAREP